MTVHHSHLHPVPFSYVSLGQKTVESRIYDAKRRSFKIGDQIIFINRADETQTVTTNVIALHRADTFLDLFTSTSVKGKFSTDSLEALLEGVGKYYSADEEAKYGVVGIEFIITDQ